MVSQRFYRFSQDPYVRANYSLIHLISLWTYRSHVLCAGRRETSQRAGAVSRRFYRFSQDPYVCANCSLIHCGCAGQRETSQRAGAQRTCFLLLVLNLAESSHHAIDSIVKRSAAFPSNSSTPLLSYTVSVSRSG